MRQRLHLGRSSRLTSYGLADYSRLGRSSWGGYRASSSRPLWLLGALLLALFILVALYYQSLSALDQLLTGWAGRAQSSSGRAPGPILVFLNWWGTWRGMVPTTVVGFLVLALLYRRTREGWLLAGGMLSGWSLIELSKLFFLRPRPQGFHLFYAGGYSFPSGHALITALFTILFLYLAWPALGRSFGDTNRGRVPSLIDLGYESYPRAGRILRALVLLVLVGATLAMGWSRVYFGVHYPTDVLGGWLAGSFWAVVWILITCQVRSRALG